MQGRRNDPHAMECPFCHAATGTLDHVVWRCRSLPDVSERPHVPRDALQARLGWPVTSLPLVAFSMHHFSREFTVLGLIVGLRIYMCIYIYVCMLWS